MNGQDQTSGFAERREMQSIKLSLDAVPLQLAVSFIGVAAALTLWLGSDVDGIQWWLGGLVAVAGMQTALYLAFRRQWFEDPTVSKAAFANVLSAAAAGLIWAAGLFLLTGEPTGFSGGLTVTAIAVLGCGLVAYGNYLRAQLVFAIPMLLAITWVIVGPDVTHHVAVGAIWLSSMVIVATMHFRPGYMSRLLDARQANAILSSDAQQSRDALARAEREQQSHQAQVRDLNNQLSRAQRDADAAQSARDEFIATISREIRTPLNGIVPLIDELIGSDLDKGQIESMATIRLAAQHQLKILDDMLDFSRMKAGKLELDISVLGVRELLDTVVAMLSAAARRKELSIKLTVDPSVPDSVRGDALRLRQILANLLSNAINATSQGTIEVRATCAGETDDDHQLRFEVCDSSAGLDPEELKTLAEALRPQDDPSSPLAIDDNGLDLAISKRLVELMDGEMSVDSQPGHGTTFWFTCWLLKPLTEMGSGARALSGVSALAVTERSNLVTELEQFAVTTGCRLLLVSDLQEAVSQIKSAHRGNANRIDVVIFDLRSTGAQCYGLARKILKQKQLRMACVAINADGQLPSVLADESRLVALSESAGDEVWAQEIRQIVPRPKPRPIPTSKPVVPPVSNTDDNLAARVLLVEDNPINLMVAKKLVSSLGIEFETAENGKVALEKLERESYDAILMDCMMPFVDGYQATRRWREIEQTRDLIPTPIIAMTANAVAGDKDKCLAAGMNAYMSKPLSRQLLADTVRKLVGGSVDSAGSQPQIKGSKHLNMTLLSELETVMGSELLDLVQAYISDAPRLIKALQRAIESHDRAEIRNHVHELRTTSVSLGAISVVGMLDQILALAETAQVAKAAREASSLARSFHDVASELQVKAGQIRHASQSSDASTSQTRTA